ncbi:MAG: type II toxin-antitoxin system HicB family antitoxin [Limisphaerales bacterium]
MRSGNHPPRANKPAARQKANSYRSLVKEVDGWWIGWVQEVPGVNAQERTKQELLRSLREALREAIEFNREAARRAADSDYLEEPLAL